MITIKNLEYEGSSCERWGCETCDYGSKYIDEFTFEINDNKYELVVPNMYEPLSSGYVKVDGEYVDLSEGHLMNWICNAAEQASDEEEFIDMLKKTAFESDYDIEIKKVEVK